MKISNSCSSLMRRKRRWPRSVAYKGKWQETFSEQQAIEMLKQAAALTPQPQQENVSEPYLLSSLINSFSSYCCEPTSFAYSFIIKAMTINSQFDKLPPVLDRLEKVEKFEPPEQIFIDLIRIYGAANMLQDAADIFFRIPNFRCVPSVYSLNALLLVLCKKREGLQMVEQVLLRTQAMNIRLEESSFKILITSLCKINKVGYAIEMLNLIPQCGYSPNVELYSLILLSMCKCGDFTHVEVLDFLEEMRKAGFVPSRVDYANVIRFLVKEDRGMDALNLLNQMKIDGMKPDTICYTMVLDGVVSAEDFQKAEELFDEMLVLGLVPDIYTYNVYINGLCKQNDVKAGFKLLDCMEQLECKPNVVTYNTLLDALCKLGDLTGAEKLVKKMELKGVQGNLHTYRIFIDGFVHKGEVVKAYGLLKEMLDRGFLPSSSTFDEIIYLFCERGLMCEAVKLLEEMVRRAASPGTKVWKALLLGYGFKSKSCENYLPPFGGSIM
ncbi:PREDICTED: pentatricopeptide repeat-containing protein At2g38420, mitochondrial [Nelumbo nucifera]|uniref:Pentatricopeptide repeat-containing protein At2g38420, mitochondrial n=2 Tax=Nelumbo nucifera TaxID=4432 RepID=A0A1U8ANS1_NELNU|nr:PREDICTED: pentatricopeptide repeat-containing protein At2g38420, mitochondrial [Nelumbo nucifera]XP_010264483.1 PREDICTED: pentatricopeptide repeat-containing protein At2g38420, mitochondrial [Nelumbo nucifera]DAD28161.1 TPA_asm: hypothetical protein HUJ06_029629 [Nelumbo nucifera]